MTRSERSQVTTTRDGEAGLSPAALGGVARRAGVAAVVAGVLFLLGQGGELVFGDDSKVIFVVIVSLLAVAILAFGVAFWSLRQLLRESGPVASAPPSVLWVPPSWWRSRSS